MPLAYCTRRYVALRGSVSLCEVPRAESGRLTQRFSDQELLNWQLPHCGALHTPLYTRDFIEYLMEVG
jgi:hypothetical protein